MQQLKKSQNFTFFDTATDTFFICLSIFFACFLTVWICATKCTQERYIVVKALFANVSFAAKATTWACICVTVRNSFAKLTVHINTAWLTRVGRAMKFV